MPTLAGLNARSDLTCTYLSNSKPLSLIYSGELFPLYAFTISELWLTIVAGSIPTLKPLYTTYK